MDTMYRAVFAGFWRRFIAFGIDYFIASACLFPMLVVMGLFVPNQVEVSVPFDLFTVERTIESARTEETHVDGSVTALEVRWVEVTVLGCWQYLYKETERHNAGETSSERQLVDSMSRNELSVSDESDFIWWFLIFYWTVMEAGKYQASVGKMAMGIKVTDDVGRALTLPRALGRNLLKWLSLFTLFIGFMMAGWTLRKQGLHDKICGCLVMKGECLDRTDQGKR